MTLCERPCLIYHIQRVEAINCISSQWIKRFNYPVSSHVRIHGLKIRNPLKSHPVPAHHWFVGKDLKNSVVSSSTAASPCSFCDAHSLLYSSTYCNGQDLKTIISDICGIIDFLYWHRISFKHGLKRSFKWNLSEGSFLRITWHCSSICHHKLQWMQLLIWADNIKTWLLISFSHFFLLQKIYLISIDDVTTELNWFSIKVINAIYK
jgi:hypothetical protein